MSDKAAVNMEIFEKIKAFVMENRYEYSFPLTRETKLLEDLSIWGDDAVEFIDLFGHEFHVDLSRFELSKYFPPEGDRLLIKLIRLVTFQKAPQYLTLTLGDLEMAVLRGYLE